MRTYPVLARTLTGLVVTTLVVAGSTVGTSAVAADRVTPGAPPLPRKLEPGSVTAPLYPLRSVPGYATPGAASVRVTAGDGGLDKRYAVATPVGSTLLWGDWNRDGAYTPAIFTNGHWVVYDAMIGPSPVPSREFDYGLPGDRPIAGDFNRDGRTDVGVVRGNVWMVRNAPDAGAPWRKFTFGSGKDVPVVGDWDGDGRDTIGVRRGKKFFLRDKLSGGPAADTIALGWAVDKPVVGDWDADGRDSVGVVRGDTWFLRDETPAASPGRRKAAKAAVVARVVPRPSNQPVVTPAPWVTPAGPDGQACPTASAAVSNRDPLGPTVRPSVLLDKNLPYDQADPNLMTSPLFQTRMALLEAEKYLLGAQYLERWYSKRGQRYTDILSRFVADQQEYAVRRPAMAALTTAVAARAKAHNDDFVGRTRDEAIRYTDWLVRSIACEHAAVTPGGWGAGWQTAHWAFLTGEAAWLVWDYLSPQTREYVAQMVVFEANNRLTKPVEYWRDEAGTELSRGDTKAEEDSWNAGILELAIAMMPKHSQAQNWRRRAVDLEVAAYSRPADLTSAQPVNGVPLADRLSGYNAFDDGTVVNHQIVHPDYMTNIQQSWWAADIAGLAGRRVPEAAFHNASLVYDAMSKVAFTEGATSPANGQPFGPPGGTIYRPGSNDVYFPQGSIWGATRRAHFVSFDAHALAWGLDTGAAWSAREALAQHVTGHLSLVANNGTGDGRTYNFDPPVANSQDSYNGREEYAASQIAAGWLSLYVSANAWDRAFGPPAIDRGTYAPLPVLTPAQTGWFGSVDADSPQRERLSP